MFPLFECVFACRGSGNLQVSDRAKISFVSVMSTDEANKGETFQC